MSERVIEITGREENNSQIDVGCCRRRQERNRALKTCPGSGEVSAFAQCGSEKSVGGARRGIEPHALAQLGHSFFFRTAVPERGSIVVVSIGVVRAKLNGALQMIESELHIALLSQDVTQQVVGFGMTLISEQRFGKQLFGGVEVAFSRGFLGLSVSLICGTCGRRTRFVC